MTEAYRAFQASFTCTQNYEHYMPKAPTYEAELLDVIQTATTMAKAVSVAEVHCAQDAMCNMRVEWESLQTILRNRKTDGFDAALVAMIKLAATTLAMATSMKIKISTQIVQCEQDDDDIDLPSSEVATVAVKPTKPKRTVKKPK